MWFLALCIFVFLVYGYHSHSDEAKLFVASIERQMDAPLFHPDSAHVNGDIWSLILSRLLAGVVVHTHLPLSVLLLALHFATIVAFLLACNLLTERVFASIWARSGALLLAAACFALPVAGTSLHLMGPYITPQSIAMPLGLFAIVACLDKSWKRVAVYLLLSAIACPLESVNWALFLVVLTMISGRRYVAALAISIFFIAGCTLPLQGIENAFLSNMNDTSIFDQLASPDYCWKQYETVQLASPLLLLSISAFKYGPTSRVGTLSMACVLIGVTAAIFSICFAHSAHAGILVPLQMLQIFKVVDTIAAILMGGLLFNFFLERGIWIGIALIIVAFGGIFLAERHSYLGLPHIELSRALHCMGKCNAIAFSAGLCIFIVATDVRCVFNPAGMDQHTS